MATSFPTLTITKMLFSTNMTVHRNNTQPASRRLNLTFRKEYHFSWLCFACAIIIANILVLCVFKSDRKLLKRTPANNLLLSLAVNDLMTGVASLLQVLPYLKQEMFVQGHVFRHFSIASDISITFLSVNSVVHLCLLAAERYLSIFYALQFKGLVTTRRVRYCVLSAWALSCIIGIIQVTWVWPLLQRRLPPVEESVKIRRIDVYYSSAVIVTFGLLPVVLLAFAYVRMFLMCKKLIREAPDNLLARKNTVNKELKILFMYFTMYLVFVILCVPFFSIRLAADIHSMLWSKVEMQIPTRLVETFVLTRFLASGVNPFIYTFYKQDFRRTIQSAIFLSPACRRCGGTGQVQNGDGNETCTKEVFHSFATHLSTVKKPVSEFGLVDMSSSLLGNRKDTNHTANGLNRSNRPKPNQQCSKV